MMLIKTKNITKEAFFMNSIAQGARFRQCVVKYSIKHSVIEASIRFRVMIKQFYAYFDDMIMLWNILPKL